MSKHIITAIHLQTFFFHFCLKQLCWTRGRAACGPVSFSILCMYNTMTTCIYFDNFKFDIFDAVVLSGSVRLSCRGGFALLTPSLVTGLLRTGRFSRAGWHFYLGWKTYF